MIWQQIWEGVQAFFAGVGILAVLVFGGIWMTIWAEDRKQKKQERARRERNWDWQETRLDRLAQEFRDLRGLVSAIDTLQDQDADRIDQLFKEVMGIAAEQIGHRQGLSEHQLAIRALEENDLPRRVKKLETLDLFGTTAERIEKLDDQQRSTQTWQQITDDELLGIYRRLDALELNERAA